MAELQIALPNLNDTDFSDAKQVRRLRDYMYMLTEQLRYVLHNLDGENLSPGLNESISAGAALGADALQGVDECRASIEQNREGIRLRVQKGEVISDINQSAEAIKIQAGRIALEGLVTANENFKILTDGSMEAVNGHFSGVIDASAGSLGAFSVDTAGNLAGAATLQVGGVTFSGSAAAGLRVTADNLAYVYGQPPNSNAAYILGVSDTGVLCLFDLTLNNGQLSISAPGSVPQSSAVSVLRITARGDGLNKRTQMNTGAPSLGLCATGEVYGYTGLSTDGAGHRWAYCNSRYSYNGATQTWTAAAVTPFYVRETNDAKTHRYFDLTTVNV